MNMSQDGQVFHELKPAVDDAGDFGQSLERVVLPGSIQLSGQVFAAALTKDGQGALGSMYYTGRGVHQDYVLAHMWFNLSAARGGSPERRDSILHQMTREQIAEAQRFAREWKPRAQPQR